jgi:hypothetical protein
VAIVSVTSSSFAVRFVLAVAVFIQAHAGKVFARLPVIAADELICISTWLISALSNFRVVLVKHVFRTMVGRTIILFDTAGELVGFRLQAVQIYTG